MTTAVVSAPLGPPLLRHLDAQLTSARQLLDLVLRQGQAIRRRDVDAVAHRIGEIEAEMQRRGALEGERTALLHQAGLQLGLPAHAVTLDAMCGLLDPATAATARERSAELRGMLTEIRRENTINRALMRQELAFLDHLLHVLGAAPHTGYGPEGAQPGLIASESRSMGLRTLDLRA